ncbi:MAG TPA: cytochrome C oxidase subunit IV family protein [Planctomycetota bacterium]|nr:cytochrome C oxidase subunit IV family protein [Planctomycetota bacterium]
MSDSTTNPPAAQASEGHGGEPAHAHAHQGPSYYLIFAALVVLTGITVGVSYVPGLSPEWALIVAMAIASLKATMVALFFMHLKFEIKPIYLVVGVPVVLTLILIVALMPDIGYHENPPETKQPAAAEAHP